MGEEMIAALLLVCSLNAPTCVVPAPLSPEPLTNPAPLTELTLTNKEWETHPEGWDDPEPQVQVETSYPLATRMGNGTSDVEQWRPLVAGHFPPEQVDNALCIIKWESGGEPRIRNLSGSNARGLFQIMTTVWGDDFGFSNEDFYSPEKNTYAAAHIWAAKGWRPWASRGHCGL